MIYLTGQLLAFLIVTASVGFILGWLLRGAMLSTSTINGADMFYAPERPLDKSSYVVSGIASDKGPKID